MRGLVRAAVTIACFTLAAELAFAQQQLLGPPLEDPPLPQATASPASPPAIQPRTSSPAVNTVNEAIIYQEQLGQPTPVPKEDYSSPYPLFDILPGRRRSS